MTRHNEKYGAWQDATPRSTFTNSPLLDITPVERAAVWGLITARGLENTTVADMLGVRPGAPAEKDQERESLKKTIKRHPVRRATHTPADCLVDASEVRAHISNFTDRGMTIVGIAREAGVTASWVHSVKAGQQHASREFADRVLAIRPPSVYRFYGSRTEAADECRRMIRELHLRGYGPVALAERFGVSRSWVDNMARGRAERTRPGNVGKVRDTYLALKHADGGNTRARNRAKRLGWELGDAA